MINQSMSLSMSKVTVVSLLSLLVLATTTSSLVAPAFAAKPDTAAFKFLAKCGATKTAGVVITVTWTTGTATGTTNAKGLTKVQVPASTSVTYSAKYATTTITGSATSGAIDTITAIVIKNPGPTC